MSPTDVRHRLLKSGRRFEMSLSSCLATTPETHSFDKQLTHTTDSKSQHRLRTPKLVVDGVAKRYGLVDALFPVDLEVQAGEFVTVLGPSGSGKTTLLQIVAGLIEPTSGRLLVDGHDKTRTPAYGRDIGVIFQSYALFPHLTVSENIAFPLQMRRLSRSEMQHKVERALELVGLTALRDRFPRELSGGQQQRVALARCFVYQPALIVMDEPLAALDRKLRESMQIEIKRLHRDTGATILFVTHDQEEALALSDRICLMNHGRIEQTGSPQDIYERPNNVFVADFVGISNVFRGELQSSGQFISADGPLPIGKPAAVSMNTRNAALVIRPEHIELNVPGATGLVGTVTESVYAGSEFRLIVTLSSGATLIARRSASQNPIGSGDRVVVSWMPERSLLLPE